MSADPSPATPRTAPTSAGQRTRREILALAVDLASAEGLEGLTIGRLARETGMSKSGLFAHFGSKEDLQLAIVAAAAELFAEDVLAPVGAASEGLERAGAMIEAWIAHVESGVFSGGCFFAAASAEFDDRPGRVRDAVAAMTADWLGRIEAELARAVDLGQLREGTDPAQLAFELHAFVGEANWSFQLHDNLEAFPRARRAMARVLQSAATSTGARLLARRESGATSGPASA